MAVFFDKHGYPVRRPEPSYEREDLHSIRMEDLWDVADLIAKSDCGPTYEFTDNQCHAYSIIRHAMIGYCERKGIDLPL